MANAPIPDLHSTQRPPWRRAGSLLLLGLGSAIALIALRLQPKDPVERITYSELERRVAAGQVADATLSHEEVRGHLKAISNQKQGARFVADQVEDPQLVAKLEAHGVEISGNPGGTSGVGTLGSWILPLLVPLALLWVLRRGAAGPQGLLGIGQSKARVYVEKEISTRFADVAGVDEAKQELDEVVRFLKQPQDFTRLGGHIPKGILLVGPPGTGKTLLARAVAGEAGVPFFSISGSEFVEMFVGVGAARVRDLFDQARRMAPSIIFIDELDALGKARNAGPMAHEEREQTLNQLLVELDGFEPGIGVILMAATNRPEILDPALLRAGRFDRHVLVDRPDKGGRLAILRLHAAKVRLANQSDLEELANMTAGMVGADLANVVNEAALLAARNKKDSIGKAELFEAVERIVAGLEKKNRILKKEEKERVAHHEVGHALVGLALPGAGTVRKVSIIPRGISALGYTLQVPAEDRFLLTRSEMENRIAQLLGGRAAEELIYGEESTGAEDDLAKATQLARSMVEQHGMSRAVGPVSLAPERGPRFLMGLPGEDAPRCGPGLVELADREVRRIIEDQFQRARGILTEQEDTLRRAAKVLLEHEVISGEELVEIKNSHPSVSEVGFGDSPPRLDSVHS